MKSSLAALLLLVCSLTAMAQTSYVPGLLSYQGHVTDSAGTPIGSTSPVNRTVLFKFYTVSSGGTPVYAESQVVTIAGGEFSVLIGNGTGVSTFKGPSAPAVTPYITLASIMSGDLYLGITVYDSSGAATAEISPRQQIVSSAYAIRAKVAEGLADLSLGTSMIADTAVTTNKIGAAQVTTAKLAAGAVITSTLADYNVTTVKIADGNVTTVKIADGAIITSKIADGAILTPKIADGVVTNAKIATGAVNSASIADASIAGADIAPGGVGNGQLASSSVDYSKLVAAVQQALCPTGTIMAYAGDTAPSGWALCDGSAVSRTTNSALFSLIGTRFGYGDNSTTFNLPDFRGMFLRGRDAGAARDPDRASRTAMNTGGATGDAVGSIQTDMFRWHSHTYADTYGMEAGGETNQGVGPTFGFNGSGKDWDNYPYSFTRTSAGNGGNESRPLNANVNYIIKL